MKVRPLPAPQIINKMKYNIIFKGASYKNRCIEVYLPEYNHSQFILKHPVGSKYLFGFTSDEFWRSHPDLEKEVRKICFDIAFKHLSFVVGWDFRENQNDYTWWSYAVKEWKDEGYITVTDEQFNVALKSFYNKYVREKGKRVFQFIEQ